MTPDTLRLADPPRMLALLALAPVLAGADTPAHGAVLAAAAAVMTPLVRGAAALLVRVHPGLDGLPLRLLLLAAVTSALGLLLLAADRGLALPLLPSLSLLALNLPLAGVGVPDAMRPARLAGDAGAAAALLLAAGALHPYAGAAGAPALLALALAGLQRRAAATPSLQAAPTA